MKKKLLALALAATMIFSLAACGGGGDSEDAVTITIFNTKSEIQDKFVEMAEEYSETHPGVNIEVYMSQDTVSAHLATKYASNDPYTLSMVDAKDVYSLGPDHALDLSDQDWVDKTDYAISVDDKVLGFPVCIEARGVMYNADAIKDITGEDFDPATCATKEGFEDLLKKLVAGGMESPTGIMYEDWSLAAHYFQEIYEEQPDVDAFVQSLYDGKADLVNNERFNSMMDTFDVLMAYNYKKDSPASAERDVTEQYLAEGKIAFLFGGNWDWSLIKDFNEEANLGMMPVPQSTNDDYNTKLVGGGSKYFFIDSSENTSEEQVQAAKDFLSWWVNEEDGNTFVTETCALVPAFKTIKAENLDPLSKDVKQYADEGKLVDNYNFDPDDHITNVGKTMQKYLGGDIDRAGLAKQVEEYWQKAKK